MKQFNLLFAIAFIMFTLSSYGQLNPDPNGSCNGDANNQVYAVKFGAYTGEYIFSNRQSNAFGNQYGLDFVTNSQYRMRIVGSGGNISIGAYATPTTKLSFGPYSGYNGVSDIGNMRLSIFDVKDAMRYGIGYYEESGPSFPIYKRIFAFYANPQGRFSFFDNYSTSSTDNTNGTGYEFVTFNAANRSVGINNTAPTAKLHVYNPGDVSEMLRLESLQSTSPVITTSLVVKNFINEVMIDALASSGTAPSLALNKNGAGNVTIGYFGPTGPGSGVLSSSQSRFHIQFGNIQITNSPAPTLSKIGLTMGATISGNANPLTDYSWIQASSGPLVLNPLSGNTLSGTQTNNYVAIGLPRTSIPAGVPNGYNLLVGGKIMCEELKIKLIAGWYDHVFNEDYKLMSLDSLETYIDQNSHLPEIPTEIEVQQNGIMAGEMSGLLLKKIEELTLYMINQNKSISNQEEQIELLKKQNELLMLQVQMLVQNNKTK